MDPFLTELRPILDRLGYTVVPHGDHLCVRLPLAASVRIYAADGRVRLVPQFGPFSRTGGLLATSTGASAVVGATLFTVGVTPVALFAGFVGVVALAHDACRFVLTESCVTRLQQLIVDLERVQQSHELSAGSSPARLAPPPAAVGIEKRPGTESVRR